METKKGNTKSNKGVYILIGLGVVAIGATAYYFITKNKTTEDFVSDDLDVSTTEEKTETHSSSGGSSSGFPLKKGSRGDLVKNIQQSLIQKYGVAILPKYGADGQWGTELDTALISKGYPTIIDADTFTKLITTGGTSTTTTPTADKPKFNPTLLADNLRLAILDDNLSKALTSLSKIYTTKGYTMVNDEFKKTRIDGVRKTVVNALLSKFWEAAEKKKLNEQFYRIGLKYNGDQWSLSGIGQILCDQIKSISPTKVWNASGTAINVPKETILGEFIDGKDGVSKFKTMDGKILFTRTNCICYV